ncbi:site-specific integrase [Klebsiella aerogenes]|uniref:tyrosine-type recombinase/integrase n=1 Tax=Klebsiella aerogenes TaxID=548 RepID=UPI002E357A90|nr:site-specific integrase [Klebsiella aerogenes]
MGAENKLSDKALRALVGKQQERQITKADGKGLSIRVSKSGAISFVFFFRTGGRDSSPIWMTLGRYPDMSLKAAREKRDQCRQWLSDGRDPRLQDKIETDKTMRPVTVKDALMYWINNYAIYNRCVEDMYLWRFNKYIFPVVGHIPVDECTKTMWVDLFDKIKRDVPVTSGYVFSDARQALRFCRKRDYAESTVLEDFSISDMGSKPKKRERVITDAELKDIMWFIDHELISNHAVSIRRVMKICLVFGCRQREIRLSTWDEWDMKKWVWIVPPAHSKNGKEIVRPVPVGIRQWLTDLKEVTKKTGLVVGEVKDHKGVGLAVNSICKILGHDKPTNWTIHDFRRTLATSLSDMGVDVYIIEQLLGHTLPGVMGIYNRSKFLDKKLDALNMWLTHLECLSGVHSNVQVLKQKVS